jgi:hypothetical protein
MAKQFGPILRGFGPPVPQAGVVGDLYIDNITFQIFEKREINGLDDWGHYLWVLPNTYRTTLKWFGANSPNNEIGVVGDYFLQWAGYPNYGMLPIIWGPKTWTGWPENGDGPGTFVVGDTVLPIGLVTEGTPLASVQPTRLTAIGLLSEYIIPIPVTDASGDPVLELGLQSSGTLVDTIDINGAYTATDAKVL